MPHAGYSYSGPAAAWAFAAAPGASSGANRINRVFVLGPSHHAYSTSISLTQFKRWETPLGELEVDRRGKRLLLFECLVAHRPLITHATLFGHSGRRACTQRRIRRNVARRRRSRAQPRDDDAIRTLGIPGSSDERIRRCRHPACATHGRQRFGRRHETLCGFVGAVLDGSKQLLGD